MIVINEHIENEEKWREIVQKYPGIDSFIGNPPSYPIELDFSLNHIPEVDKEVLYCSPNALEIGEYLDLKTGTVLNIDGQKTYDKKKNFLVKL